MAAVVRAARQQGQHGPLGRLLAWRRALGDLHPHALPLQQEEQQQEQQPVQRQQHHSGQQQRGQALLLERPGLVASAAWPAALQQARGLSHGAPEARAAAYQRQQRRGMALGFVRYQKRRSGQREPERELPARNQEITADPVRVVYPEGDERPSEVLRLKRALALAREMRQDLVMVSPRADPPVVRITEWSKVLYDAQKREKAATKQRLAQQRAAEPKEVRIGCQIAEHDLKVKMGQARRFLEEGHMLRLVVTFKGGAQLALGRDVALYLVGQLADLSKLKDQAHLQKPQRGQWAVMLVPEAPKPPSKKQAAAAAGSAPAAEADGGGAAAELA